jgi:hypothetical protein
MANVGSPLGKLQGFFHPAHQPLGRIDLHFLDAITRGEFCITVLAGNNPAEQFDANLLLAAARGARLVEEKRHGGISVRRMESQTVSRSSPGMLQGASAGSEKTFHCPPESRRSNGFQPKLMR